MDNEQIIFDLSRKDWKYKGVFFGEMDNAAVDKECNAPFPTPKGYVAGMMAIIYTDEKGIWHLVARIKFPSGNKQVIRKAFNEKEDSNKTINETYCLQFLYKMPMINKVWTPNPSGEGWDILEIIKNLDMVESMRIESVDAKN